MEKWLGVEIHLGLDNYLYGLGVARNVLFHIQMSLQNSIPIDERFYNLSMGPEEVQYLKAETGIEDDDALKAHVLQVQQKAYKVLSGLSAGRLIHDRFILQEYPYPCILYFVFIK